MNLMKTTKLIKFFMFIALTLIGLCVSSCKGADGNPGQNGADGNANVGTYTFSLNIADLQYNTTYKEYSSDVTIANIQSNDAIFVYMIRETVDLNDYWVQLPFQDWYDANGYNTYTFEYALTGNMKIQIRNSFGNAPYNPMTGKLYFKMVVIKGTPLRSATVPTFLNTKNYNEVKAFYNLKN
jgi:hypothetical protein